MISMYSLGNDLYTGKRSFQIIAKRKIWFAIAIFFILLSIAGFALKTPNLGIEFRGGSQFTVTGTENTSQGPAYEVIAEVGNDKAPRISSVGGSGIRVQTVQLDDQQTQAVKQALAEAYGVPETDVTSTYVGPSWGQDILNKAIRGMLIFMVAVSVVMIAYFRSWTIAVGAIGALLHDFIVTLGAYWLLGLEVTPATIIGILTIMGYSLYDTVVVFDKVRENTSQLRAQKKVTFEETANLAINQTLIRSLNTSITGLLPVAAVLVIGVGIFGADTLRDLALVMFIGMLLSTISSIFLAAPLAVSLGMRNQDIKEHTNEVLKMREENDVRSKDLDNKVPIREEQDTLAESALEDRVAGTHKGNRAQPKRKKRK
ncbi:MAG: protein translocase subunit SecF [Arcanobacterium sp.]|nr:protein translocase subunit SecF [Arcanobacterium sp.]